ncbi:hypothetical protein Tco_1376399 [Tanacetum coccineum]
MKVFTQFPALGLPCATLSYNLSHRWGLGLSEMNWKGDIRAVVEWGKVRGELGEVLERWYGKKTVGKGSLGLAGKLLWYSYG